MATKPTFRWRVSYMGTVWYDVTDETGSYSAALRHSASNYELSIANGDEVRRDIKTEIGILRREFPARDGYAMPAATVAAFNDWRMERHRAFMAHLEAAPERYGVIAADDALRQDPKPARRGDYVAGAGWRELEPG